jgi:hypothetical protein
MIPEHIKYLRCPETQRILELKSELIENGRVKKGMLIETIKLKEEYRT